MRISGLMITTAALVAAAPALAQSGEQYDEQLRNPPNDAVRNLTNLVFSAGSQYNSAEAAGRNCNLQDIASAISQLKQIQKQARDAESGARAAGKYSAVEPGVAHRAYYLISLDLDRALAIQQACPQVKAVDQPTLPPAEVFTPSQSPVEQPTLPPTEVFTPPQPLKPFDQRILDLHNAERAAVGAQPLHWDPMLAAHALDYAHQLAQTGQMVHAPLEGRGIERENLQRGLIGWGADRMVQDWVGEKTDFIPGNFPNVARDGNWMRVAHYTQMIWPTTTSIGCGEADGLGFSWFVCRYSPGGNKDGKPVVLDGSSFASTGRIDHDFKYGFAYRNTPISSESAWDGGAFFDSGIWDWSVTSTGSISIFPDFSVPSDPLDLLDPIDWDAPM